MQNPQGRILSAHSGSAGDRQTVTVEVETGAICKRCESGKGCGAGLLGSNARSKVVSATVAANLDVRQGDLVSIALRPSNILQAAIVVYGYPLAGAVLGAAGGYGFGLGDAGAALAALSGIVGGFLLARVRLRSQHCLQEFTPVVLNKLPPAAVAD